MPISYEIDPTLHRVIALASGTLGIRDLSRYQREVWSRDDLTDFDELLDGSRVESLLDLNLENLKQLADLARSMDKSSRSVKFALVAPQDLHYGLGRMYQALRYGMANSLKTMSVFRSREDAEKWLDTPPD
jgi:ATP phosphoribosyltransferase regulatory subunit HisZ